MRPPKPTRPSAMTTDIVTTTNVVKNKDGDDTYRLGDNGLVANFADRIDRILGRLGGISVRELERRCEIKRGTLQNAKTRGGTEALEWLRKLRDDTGVDLNWLVCGRNAAGKDDDGLRIVPAEETAAIVERTRRASRLLLPEVADKPSGRHPSGRAPK